MSNKNCNKVSNTCTDNVQAPCVDYQGELGNSTKITSPCVTIEDVAEDLYQITDEIIENSSTEELGETCIEIPNNATTAQVLKKYEEEICMLKQQVETLQTDFICQATINDCGLNLSNLQNSVSASSCINPLQTLKDVLQAIIDKL